MNIMHHRYNSLQMTPERFAAFKKDYTYAQAEGFDAFVFDGHPVLVSYAKYLIEYFELRFGL